MYSYTKLHTDFHCSQCKQTVVWIKATHIPLVYSCQHCTPL